jgi:hypothetical protein
MFCIQDLLEKTTFETGVVLCLKILPSQKRGGSRRLPIIDSSSLPTQSSIFFLHYKGYSHQSHSLNLKRPVSAFRAKKCAVFFAVESWLEIQTSCEHDSGV